MTYEPRRAPRHETREFRGLAHHLLHWGPDSDDPLLFLHGYGDAAATFQFVADEIAPELPIVAIDWRGFGLTARSPAGCYWFPDYYADLEQFVAGLCRKPARLVGHSMGANVAMIYAGARPERVRALVNLEGFGLARTTPDQAPARIAKWLDQLAEPAEAGDYADLAGLAERIRRRNPRLPADRAHFVASCWSKPGPGGGVRLLADSAHRLVNPYLFRREEMEACLRRIAAPVLLILGDRSELVARLGAEGGVEAFRPLLQKLHVEIVAGAGHMLHHEEPRAVARLIEAFFRES